MHNRALHDSLAAFVEEAAWQLAEEVSGGAEIPFELDATPTRSSPLYCYRPLTGRFIAQRIGMLSRLPSYPFAAQGLDGAAGPAGLPRAAAAASRRATRGRSPTARCRPSSAPSGPTPPTSPSSASASTWPTPSSRTSPTPAASSRVVITAVEGLVIESEEVPLGEGLSLVRATTLADAPAGLSDDPHATVAVLALETSAGDGRALENAGRRLRRLQSALRLWDDAEPALGPTAWAKTDGSAWMAVPLATGLRRPAGDCLLAAEEEDPLRAFCGLVSRRTPRAGELAWALRRFELGCERGNAVEALTDWLMAARALFADTDRAGYDGVAERLAAICAELHDRPRLEARMREAISLERAAMAGFVRSSDEVDALVVRARRLPACGVARRALRASGPGAAACRRRAAGRRRAGVGSGRASTEEGARASACSLSSYAVTPARRRRARRSARPDRRAGSASGSRSRTGSGPRPASWIRSAA